MKKRSISFLAILLTLTLCLPMLVACDLGGLVSAPDGETKQTSQKEESEESEPSSEGSENANSVTALQTQSAEESDENTTEPTAETVTENKDDNEKVENTTEPVSDTVTENKDDNEKVENTTDTASDTTDESDTTDDSVIADGRDYTYVSPVEHLNTNWNPHAYADSVGETILGYISSPFVDISVKDSEKGVYQWVFEMATSITDVTAANRVDLTRYSVTLPEGKYISDVTEGYVYEIKLNPDARWENGERITADDYIESFKRLLDPAMKNSKALDYYDGEAAVAGGYEYYYSTDTELFVCVYTKYDTVDEAIAAGDTVYLDMHNFYALSEAVDEHGNYCPQWVSVTDTVKYCDPADGSWVSAADIYANYSYYLENGAGYESYVSIYALNEDFGATWDVVGLYKVDDYTIRYVSDSYIDYYNFLTNRADTWLVYIPLYDQLKNTSGDLVTTDYATSKETTFSYGTYRMEYFNEDNRAILVRNENWYGWEKDANGNLYSYTDFEVDGEKRLQYQTTRIILKVMNVYDSYKMKDAFLMGEVSEWQPATDELTKYTLSSRLYKADETYVMSFFFNTDVNALTAMDEYMGNANSVVLSNDTFRKAFSLSINRAEFVSATLGYKPSVCLVNNRYYYDFYDEDKEDGIDGSETQYRNTVQAMQAIVDLYGVEYGEDQTYKTLKEAYDSITGYNLAEAKKLMKTAYNELVRAGLYTEGEPIHIKIGWAKGSLTSADYAQIALMNKYINAAIEGSGFGKITFEAVGDISHRYDAVPYGEYAIGYGAWGGSEFNPFRYFQVYMDPDQYSINEAACYDPKIEKLTLTFVDADGNTVTDTMTWQAWSWSMLDSDKYGSAETATKVAILAKLEEAFLKRYYRIPICTTTVCSLLSYQCEYYTENYNSMYGFGGIRLMSYNYDDEAWEAFVDEQLEKYGEIDYK